MAQKPILVTEALIKTVTGGSPNADNVRSVVFGLAAAGTDAGLDQAQRFAHYLAQLAHESGRFQYDEEVWGPTPAQRRYEDRADLGHSAAVPGEAFKFRGRTGIQLTGRHNAVEFRDWCRGRFDPAAVPDFEANPDLLNTDPWEGLAPIWFWDFGNPTGRSLNAYADDNNLEAITRKINGGLNGFEDRTKLYVRAALVLLGYELKAGVVRQFQQDAGFTGNAVDDIPGTQTRAAMHHRLMFKAPRLDFGFERLMAPEPAPAPEADEPLFETDIFDAVEEYVHGARDGLNDLEAALRAIRARKDRQPTEGENP